MLSKLEIRCLERHDRAYIEGWLLEQEFSGFAMSSAWEMRCSTEGWMQSRASRAGLIAVVKGVVCGFAVLNLSAQRKTQHRALVSILVDSQYQRQGVGWQLLEELQVRAWEEFNLRFLYLEVLHSNYAAIQLYKKAGFEEVGVRKNFYCVPPNPPQDILIMELSLIKKEKWLGIASGLI